MGEIADMMLDGTLCECCGEYIEDGESEGFPRYCSTECAKDRGVDFDASIFGDDEDDDVPSVKGCKDLIDHVICYLEICKDDLEILKIKHKANAVKGIIKQLNIFKNSMKNKGA
jgi:hypothetical protein